MTKKILKLIIFILIITGIIVLVWAYLNFQKTPAEDRAGTTILNYLPFSSQKTEIPTEPTTEPATPTTEENIPNEEPTAITKISRLKRLTNFATAGMTVFEKERIVKNEELNTLEKYDFSLAPLIKPNDASEYVEKIQAVLNRQIPSPELIIDGIYNPETVAAIKALQKKNKITADGIIGKKTIALINNIQNPKQTTELATLLRYVKRSNGHIYEQYLDNNQEREVSTTDIPQIYETYFSNTANSVVFRYLKNDLQTIETYVGKLKEKDGEKGYENYDFSGYFLPENISEVSLSPNKESLFYLIKTEDENSGNKVIGTSLHFLTEQKKQIFSHYFTEWLIQWSSLKKIVFTTKPSSQIPGYSYFYDLARTEFIKTLGEINGLTTLYSPNEKMILYSDSNLNLKIYNLEKNDTLNISLSSLPEKCTWTKDAKIIYCAIPKSITAGTYPDAWYQGMNSFTDNFWKIDPQTGKTELVIDDTDKNFPQVDATNLTLDKQEKNLFFKNKNDSIYWALSL